MAKILELRNIEGRRGTEGVMFCHQYTWKLISGRKAEVHKGINTVCWK